MAEEAKEEFLEFETAMRDFSTMFPSISHAEIERVLRSNDGDVARTVDDLLLISLETTQISTTASTSFRSQSAPSAAAKAVHFASSARRSADDASPSMRAGKILRLVLLIINFLSLKLATKPVPLRLRQEIRYLIRVSRLSADDVVRERARIEKMKRENERRLDVVCDEKEARLLEDEQLALLMQNKEFIRWLRREQFPYMSSSSHTTKPQRKRSSHGKDHGPRVPEGPVVDELIINAEPDLKDRLKNVSKVSKERLLQLAARFRRSNDAHLNAF
ncbi:CUE domain protein [Necator americanus]|uniref:CUE domain protein n=1 Tax=Necator americanus TaxID=51031 RepID=W2T860_NECAM|nr:CUE domain protein [Necator americanus]ETN77356.1 CUE domain protein [Necator americanus]